MQALELSCDSAQSCISGPCPTGYFCFPFTCESFVKDEPSISGNRPFVNDEVSASYYCAANMAELDERCGLATECSQNGKTCPNGLSCLPFSCKQSLHKCPLNFVGWHSSQDCRTYYECSNGVAGASKMCKGTQKFDKVRGECVTEDLVDRYCYGPPITAIEEECKQGTCFCATGMAELNVRCGLATKCTGHGDSCLEGQSCLLFNCKQSLDMCPLNFVGWWGSQDCKSYYECSNGVAGASKRCRENQKFDKLRGVCISGELVDQYCHGAPVSNKEKWQQAMLDCSDFIGWQFNGDCKEYNECKVNGSVGPTLVCPTGMKFDRIRHLCINKALVDNFCYGPALETESNMGYEFGLETGSSFQGTSDREEGYDPLDDNSSNSLYIAGNHGDYYDHPSEETLIDQSPHARNPDLNGSEENDGDNPSGRTSINEAQATSTSPQSGNPDDNAYDNPREEISTDKSAVPETGTSDSFGEKAAGAFGNTSREPFIDESSTHLAQSHADTPHQTGVANDLRENDRISDQEQVDNGFSGAASSYQSNQENQSQSDTSYGKSHPNGVGSSTARSSSRCCRINSRGNGGRGSRS